VFVAERIEAGFLARDHRFVGPFDRLAVAGEPSAPLLECVERSQRARAIRLLDPQLLLGLREFAPRGGGRSVGGLARRLRFGQSIGNLEMARFGLLGAHRGVVEQAGPAFALGAERFLALAPVRLDGRELHEARFEPLARVVQMAQFGFEPCDLGGRGEEVGLRRVRGLGRGEMRVACRFDRRFEFLQPRAVDSIFADSWLSSVSSRVCSARASLRLKSHSSCWRWVWAVVSSR